MDASIRRQSNDGLVASLKTFAPYLLSLVFPMITVAFLLTGPHPWWLAPLFASPGFVMVYLDKAGMVEKSTSAADLPTWPFDLLLYCLAFLQLLTIVLLARMFATQGIFSVDMVLVMLIVGASSGFSISTAHELIHRPNFWQRQLGRLMLCTVCYEHFYTEHLRGHHVRVGTARDPATARFGESFPTFMRRTIPQQFRSAWQIERLRVGNVGLLDIRIFKNHIVQGILVSAGIAIAITMTSGVAALVAFLLQAFSAIRVLEAVNYLEHWGLTRRTKRVTANDAWDTHSWLTHYALTGLARHSDHHMRPARPFQQLGLTEAPMLPAGYFGSLEMIMTQNDEYMRQATAELKRKELGPFALGAEAQSTGTAAETLMSPEPAARNTGRPETLRRTVGGLVWYGVLLVVLSVGSMLESGGSFASVLGANALILAAFAIVFASARLLKSLSQNELVRGLGPMVVLIAVGLLVERLQ